MKRAVVFSFIFVWCTGCTLLAAQPPERVRVADNEHVKKIDQLLTGLEKEGLDGVVIIRSRNATLLHKAYGFADRQNRRPMLVTTGFDIGSIVKPFTKAAILKLEEQGKLSTADTLDKHFKGVPEDKKKITIDHLIVHTSGLPDTFGSDYDVVTKEALQAKVFAAILISSPGEKRNYSNSGYSLLAMIIEGVSGKPYERFVRDEIFKPAGTDGIGYKLASWKTKDLAVGFYKGRPWGTPLDRKWADDGPSWNLRGNGGMLATAEQTSNWFESLLEGKVLKPVALEKFLKTSSGVSRSIGARLIAVAGGNDVFNSIQYSLVESDFHFHFVTSNAKFGAEQVLPQFRDDLTVLAKAAIGAK